MCGFYSLSGQKIKYFKLKRKTDACLKIISSYQHLITAYTVEEPHISSCPCYISHCFMIQSDVLTRWQQLFGHLKAMWVNYFLYVQRLPGQVQWGPQRSLLQPSPYLQPTSLSVWPWRNSSLGLGTGVSVCRGKSKINHNVWVSTCMSLWVFLSLLTSAPAIPVIWYQDPTVCKSIQYSLSSLQQWRTRGQDWED